MWRALREGSPEEVRLIEAFEPPRRKDLDRARVQSARPYFVMFPAKCGRGKDFGPLVEGQPAKSQRLSPGQKLCDSPHIRQ
jgi:hypothetical protein